MVEAVYHSRIPIVTGIGHERDETLCDLTADYYAITPTAAANFVTISTNKLKDQLMNSKTNLNNFMLKYIISKRLEFKTKYEKIQQFNFAEILLKKRIFLRERLVLTLNKSLEKINRSKNTRLNLQFLEQYREKISNLKIITNRIMNHKISNIRKTVERGIGKIKKSYQPNVYLSNREQPINNITALRDMVNLGEYITISFNDGESIEVKITID